VDLGFKIVITPTFLEIAKKLYKKDRSIEKKLRHTFEKLKINPFEGKRIAAKEQEQRRVWVGDSHRLFYVINDNGIIPVNLKKKDKHTYR